MSFLAPRARLVPRLLPASRPFSSSPVASTSTAQPDSPAPDATSAPPPVSELAPEPTDPTEAEAAPLDPEPAGRAGKGFRAWLASDGARFRHGIKGQTNWIGETPFPLNPSFRPLAPLADATKTRIFNTYVHNIIQPNATDSVVVRAISEKFGVSMDRIRAIIRLKELEKSWKDSGKPLQTNLLTGMESYLGVRQPSDKWRGTESPEPEKPHLAQSKTIFEMLDIESGDAPVLLPLVKRAAPTLAAQAKQTQRLASKKPSTTVVPASRPGRAATTVVDLSGTAEGQKLAGTYDPKKTKRGNRKRTTV